MVLCTISSFPVSNQLLASVTLISFPSVFFSTPSLFSFSPPPISCIFSFPSFLPLRLPTPEKQQLPLRVPSVPAVPPHPAPSSRRPDGGGAPHAAGLPAPWRPGHQSLSIWPDASRRLSCPLWSSQVLGPRKPQAPESPGKLRANSPAGNRRSPPVFPPGSPRGPVRITALACWTRPTTSCTRCLNPAAYLKSAHFSHLPGNSSGMLVLCTVILPGWVPGNEMGVTNRPTSFF